MTIPTFNLGIKLPSNAVLTFPIKGIGTTTDSVGNVVANESTVELKATLTELGDKTSDNQQPGLDIRYRNMRGYILDTVPDNVLLKGRIDCVIGKETGVFHFTERITPFKAEIIKQIGVPIQGSFETQGGGN